MQLKRAGPHPFLAASPVSRSAGCAATCSLQIAAEANPPNVALLLPPVNGIQRNAQCRTAQGEVVAAPSPFVNVVG